MLIYSTQYLLMKLHFLTMPLSPDASTAFNETSDLQATLDQAVESLKEDCVGTLKLDDISIEIGCRVFALSNGLC